MADRDDWYGAETATLGDRITAAREAAGMTQAELARRMGVRLPTVAAWEDDQAEPRANRLQMLAGLLGVSLRWLLTGEGDGLGAPVEDPRLQADARALLTEMRGVQGEMVQLAERLGRLEKRVRALVREAV